MFSVYIVLLLAVGALSASALSCSDNGKTGTCYTNSTRCPLKYFYYSGVSASLRAGCSSTQKCCLPTAASPTPPPSSYFSGAGSAVAAGAVSAGGSCQAAVSRTWGRCKSSCSSGEYYTSTTSATRCSGSSKCCFGPNASSNPPSGYSSGASSPSPPSSGFWNGLFGSSSPSAPDLCKDASSGRTGSCRASCFQQESFARSQSGPQCVSPRPYCCLPGAQGRLTQNPQSGSNNGGLFGLFGSGNSAQPCAEYASNGRNTGTCGARCPSGRVAARVSGATPCPNSSDVCCVYKRTVNSHLPGPQQAAATVGSSGGGGGAWSWLFGTRMEDEDGMVIESSGGLTGGGIALIVGGVVLLLVCIVAVVACVLRQRRRSSAFVDDSIRRSSNADSGELRKSIAPPASRVSTRASRMSTRASRHSTRHAQMRLSSRMAAPGPGTRRSFARPMPASAVMHHYGQIPGYRSAWA